MLNYSFVINDKKIKKSNLPLNQFSQAVKIIAKKMKVKKDLYFDLSFLTSKKIHDINKKYRHVDRPTDVISFAFRDSKESFNTPLLGEIFICYSVALKQAKQNKNSIAYELTLLFVHGILHLFQFDHMTQKDYKKMVSLQQSILKDIIF